MKDWKKEIWTIPNLLSLFRLVLIPVYVVMYLLAEDTLDYVLAASVLAVSCLTDMVDGKIARRFNMVTRLGKILDPIADKFTQFSLLVCLCIEFPAIVTLLVLFVLKELFQLFAGWMALRKRKMLRGALLSGKISTTVLFVSLTVMVCFHQKMTPLVVCAITAVDSVFLLIAFVHYAYTYYKKTPMIEDI